VRVRAGSVAELQERGRLLTKVGAQPVVVFWHEGRAWAIDDRCPHMGFPLRHGTVADGLVTCHWHHARFDLASGCTLDLFADDARAYDVTVAGGEVLVAPRPDGDAVERLRARLRDGLEEGLGLVTAKSVLVAMANLLPHLDAGDRPLALVHGLAFVSRDTRGRPPWFPVHPLGPGDVPVDRLAGWYRRFVDTRSGEAAERLLATALAGGHPLDAVERMMFAAVTDHVFIDDGHTLDFTNKAFEALAHVGVAAAPAVLPTLARQTAAARRLEETAAWRHPHDLAGLVTRSQGRLAEVVEEGAGRSRRFEDVGGLGWRLLADDPEQVVAALAGAGAAGATPEQLGRAVAYAAALRITRFHPQNDFGDWDTVHHAFTTANALHQALLRRPTPELFRGLVHGALRIHLDRFLNVPPARLAETAEGDLDELASCWDVQGRIDRAGAVAYGFLRGGGDPARLVAALGHALVREDAGFHWFQVVEAGVRQFHAWPARSEEGARILAGVARFLAAHTPTRRELPRVVDTATRLRRGEVLYEELG
jgi:nitrite reductase/ring-hydroxylating ferredoxin subunit